MKRFPAKPLGTLAALLLLGGPGAAPVAAQQCQPVKDKRDGMKYWFQGLAEGGVDTVTVYVPPGTPASLKGGLEQAIKAWKSKKGTGETEGTCAGSENLPHFQVADGDRSGAEPPPGRDHATCHS